ncbi:helix-turn-helix domain-containing protein [Paenibacillus sp. UMB7766-LJ446]|uniref:helix-turn-helix domain-containing protein n=1 Tax=Paenibacillus sp. UMB7766-LJ446 TaxID=3046313 RepID=UPI0025502942|nr:helix-turn-helix domain-containing protein [Paenibacillus sp. UMB7766-LJ446]MDK8189001.1 helix-turn-helix domain-containing protein [Paenibacillus sp. UMB7766-LJ446]
MMASTTDFIEALRVDIKQELRDEIMAEIKPDIERLLYANVFDFSEACRYLKVSDSTLRRMVKNGEIPFIRNRTLIHFRQIALDKWLEVKEKSSSTG